VKYLVRVTENTITTVNLLSEQELVAQRISNECLLLKIIPSRDSPGTFLIENCSQTGVYEEGNDKLWLITKSLRFNGKVQVVGYVDHRSIN